jgi:hypothetical protein
MKGDKTNGDYVSDFREMACCRKENKPISGTPNLKAGPAWARLGKDCPASSITMYEKGPWLSVRELLCTRTKPPLVGDECANLMKKA